MATDDQNDDPNDPGRLRQMFEEANARAAAAEAKANELARRDVFRDAGFDLKNRQHQAFVKAYDGELDPTAVASYVAELGVTSRDPEPAPSPSPQAPQVPPALQGVQDLDEQAALIRIAEAARDGGGAPPAAPDRTAELERQMDEAARRNAPISVLDALSLEYAKARGGPVVEQG